MTENNETIENGGNDKENNDENGYNWMKKDYTLADPEDIVGYLRQSDIQPGTAIEIQMLNGGHEVETKTPEGDTETQTEFLIKLLTKGGNDDLRASDLSDQAKDGYVKAQTGETYKLQTGAKSLLGSLQDIANENFKGNPGNWFGSKMAIGVEKKDGNRIYNAELLSESK